MFYFRFASIWMQKNSDRRVPARKKMIEKAQRCLTPFVSDRDTAHNEQRFPFNFFSFLLHTSFWFFCI